MTRRDALLDLVALIVTGFVLACSALLIGGAWVGWW